MLTIKLLLTQSSTCNNQQHATDGQRCAQAKCSVVPAHVWCLLQLALWWAVTASKRQVRKKMDGWALPRLNGSRVQRENTQQDGCGVPDRNRVGGQQTKHYIAAWCMHVRQAVCCCSLLWWRLLVGWARRQARETAGHFWAAAPQARAVLTFSLARESPGVTACHCCLRRSDSRRCCSSTAAVPGRRPPPSAAGALPQWGSRLQTGPTQPPPLRSRRQWYQPRWPSSRRQWTQLQGEVGWRAPKE